jgi:type II secretory pathway pseudopilin PulG
MASRARKMRSDEDGFIIIEVLVSALILAIVAGAVLTLIAATTRGAAVQRDHSAALDLAQADQARLRTLKLTEINGIKTETTAPAPVIDGVEYEVKSERVFVNNKLGAAACASASVKPDYVQMTSTVSSSTMDNPVVLQSVVSPSSGSLDENNGTLTAKTLNAEGKPLSGVTVTATSAASGTRTAKTGAEGCTNFVSVPASSYNVTYNGNGLINTKGEFDTTKNPEVVSLLAGEYKSTAITSWDHAATLEPQFVYLEPGTGILRLAPVDSMTVANATNGVSLPVGTPGGARSSVLSKAVFPFKSPSAYTVYAGSCTTNNPGTAGANATGIYSAVLAPNEKPLGIQIHVPALEVTVKNASGAIAVGAKVTVTDSNSACKSEGASIKRTYWTNSAGHLASELAKTKPTEAATEAGLPFGTYAVCASLKVGTEFQSVSATAVKVENFTSTGTTLALNLAKAGKECT